MDILGEIPAKIDKVTYKNELVKRELHGKNYIKGIIHRELP